MEKVYQVVEVYYLLDETHETVWGTYSNEKKAQDRAAEVKQAAEVDPNHIFIKEILLDVDVNEACVCG